MNLSATLMAILLAGATILAFTPSPAGAHPPPFTQAQRLERQKVLFSKMDKNRDGQVSLEEYLPYYHVECDKGRGRFMEYGFRKYDRNGDGFITLQEFLEPVTVRDNSGRWMSTGMAASAGTNFWKAKRGSAPWTGITTASSPGKNTGGL